MWDLISQSVYAGALISIAIGIIGSLIVINKASGITGSIAHGSFGGVGIGIFLGTSILLSTAVFTVLLAVILAVISIRFKHRQDSLISVIWALGMSIGIVLVSLANGYHGDLMNYLFGNIMLVGHSDIHIMEWIDALLVISAVILYHRFLAMSYDREFLTLRGINSNLLYTYFLILTSLTIVMSVRAIGIILILALFTIPSIIAEKFTKNFWQMMVLSAVMAFLFITGGILLSANFNISPTPAIVLIASGFLFLSMAVRKKD